MNTLFEQVWDENSLKKQVLLSIATLSLNSSLNPNWFSGFPSGTLYFLNHSTVASR